MEPFYMSFEKFYDPSPVSKWMKNHLSVPLITVFLYYVLIFSGQRYMKDKEPWRLKKSLAAWNLLLSTFSIIGTIRCTPNLLHNLFTLSVRDNFCIHPETSYGAGSTGLWAQLFILSKFPELLDTFFIVVNKKPLIFLHWYHHITVLLYCWHSYAFLSPTGIFFICMNYFVHAVMYGYYFLMAVKMKPAWLNPMIITSLQILQMIVGVVVTIMSLHYYRTESECELKLGNNMAGFLMYGSYLYLFLDFFFARYRVKATKKKAV